jgi:membrane dipeptidase
VQLGIVDVVGHQALLVAFRAHGYGEALLRMIAHENWFRVLERTWGA